jgi:perosamine synthetase
MNSFLSRIYINLSFLECFKFFISFFSIKSKKNFQYDFKDYIGKKNIIMTGSGRAALFLILNQIKLDTDKREILISPYTLTEVINVIEYAGFIPKFVDINLESGLPEISDEIIKSDTCAIFITHLFTSGKKFQEKISQYRNRLLIIEDAAINFGAKFENGNFFGTNADYGFFSFGSAKNLCLVNGGAAYFKKDTDFNKAEIFYNNNYIKYPSIILLIQFFQLVLVKLLSSKLILNFIGNFFIKKMYKTKNFLFKKLYPGLNPIFSKKTPRYCIYRLSKSANIIGSDILKKEKNELILRRNKAMYYSNKIKNFNKNKIKIFYESNFNENCFIEFPIFLNNTNIDRIHKFFLDSNIDLRYRWYINNSKFDKFNSTNQSFLNSDLCEKKILCLPLHKNIDIKQMDIILKKLNEAINKY